MVFNLVPVAAQRIDISEVDDIERERFRATFEDGSELFFRVSTRYEDGLSRLAMILDPSLGSGKSLHSELARRFYDERVYRSRGAIIRDAIMMRPSYIRPYSEWTFEKVAAHIEVRVEMGRPDGVGPAYASSLQKGSFLEVEYGTQYSNPETELLVRKGKVLETDTFIIPATAARRVAVG